jgi:hypothetical protein
MIFVEPARPPSDVARYGTKSRISSAVHTHDPQLNLLFGSLCTLNAQMGTPFSAIIAIKTDISFARSE